MKKPKIKKETIKEDILRSLESRSTDLMAKPEPIQTPTKENANIAIWANILLVYQLLSLFSMASTDLPPSS